MTIIIKDFICPYCNSKEYYILDTKDIKNNIICDSCGNYVSIKDENIEIIK